MPKELSRLGTWIVKQPSWTRRFLRMLCLLLVDAISLLIAFWVTSNLRFDGQVSAVFKEITNNHIHWVLLTYLGVMYLLRQYSKLWRYAGGRDLLIQAIVLMLAGGLTLLWNRLFDWDMPRSVLMGSCLYMIGIATGTRIFARSLRSRMRHWGIGNGKAPGTKAVPLLIVGAGEAASYILTQNRRGGHMYGTPLALVDDAPEKQQMRVQNVSVMGTIDDIPQLVAELSIREIIIAMPSVKGERLQQIIKICNATRCRVRIMSDPQQAAGAPDNKPFVLRQPNLADFLSRDETRIDEASVGAYLSGKTVLVTGGGGSIGSEICRQVMHLKPKQLLIFDIYENCAYELLMDFQRRCGRDCPVEILVGSVRDRGRLDEVMARYQPAVVFHTAGHKHVPLMETSPVEAVKNNVFGTLNVLKSAEAHGVERFVMLSTDKAVNPTSVMGATKRVAEIAMQSFAVKARMRCSAVRFGNVLGSHGSVIPLFEAQIRAGGPVTLTHPDITRYFMTIPEAASLVLQAGAMASSGRIFVLEMGEPVRIMDLAEKLIRFYGYEPDENMPIQIIGLRPGEKLYEELLLDEEQAQMTRTAHEKIMIAPPLTMEAAQVSAAIERLRQAADDKDDAAVRSGLKAIVPTFEFDEPTNITQSRF